jgi:DNA-binding MurR/RpiR family transcriptional regulator
MQAAQTPEPILSRVRRAMGALTTTESKVARALLDAYPIAGLETVAQLGQRAGVSGPTVLRFVGKLGFESYVAFQQALHNEVQEKMTSSLALMEQRRHELREDALTSGLTRYTEELGRTFSELAPAEVQAIVELLADERRPVVCIGGRFSYLLALYLTSHLDMLRSRCRYVDTASHPGLEGLLDVDRRTVLVVFDYRRYQNSTIAAARWAAERGATVVLFTDPWLSPIAELARHVVTSSVAVLTPFESQVPAMATVEVVIAALAARLGDKVRPRMEELERLRTGVTWGPWQKEASHDDHDPR